MPRKIRYTIQQYSDSGSFASPPNGLAWIQHCHNRREVMEHHAQWAELHDRLGVRDLAQTLVWFGEIRDTTDIYPAYILTTGPRGGIRWEVC